MNRLANGEETSAQVVAARQRATREKQQRLELALQELKKIQALKEGKRTEATGSSRVGVIRKPAS